MLEIVGVVRLLIYSNGWGYWGGYSGLFGGVCVGE